MNNQFDTIDKLLKPFGFKDAADLSTEYPIFYRPFSIQHLGSPFAFTVLTVTLWPHSYILEGLNDFRLQRALRAGIIELESPEQLDEFKEVLFESTYDQYDKFVAILRFVIDQLFILEQEKRHTDAFKKALVDLEMVSTIAKQVE